MKLVSFELRRGVVGSVVWLETSELSPISGKVVSFGYATDKSLVAAVRENGREFSDWLSESIGNLPEPVYSRDIIRMHTWLNRKLGIKKRFTLLDRKLDITLPYKDVSCSEVFTLWKSKDDDSLEAILRHTLLHLLKDVTILLGEYTNTKDIDGFLKV